MDDSTIRCDDIIDGEAKWNNEETETFSTNCIEKYNF